MPHLRSAATTSSRLGAWNDATWRARCGSSKTGHLRRAPLALDGRREMRSAHRLAHMGRDAQADAER